MGDDGRRKAWWEERDRLVMRKAAKKGTGGWRRAVRFKAIVFSSIPSVPGAQIFPQSPPHSASDAHDSSCKPLQPLCHP